MPPKAETLPQGVLKLSKILTTLKSSPKLTLNGVKALRLSYAYQNDHFGARHFVADDLPRIQFANPELQVQVERVRKTKTDNWAAAMELEFNDGKTHKVDISDKWSTSILKEIMDKAGGDAWKTHAAASKAAGVPLLPGEDVGLKEEERLRERRAKAAKALKSETVFLKEYLEKHPEKAPKKRQPREKKEKKEKGAPSPEKTTS